MMIMINYILGAAIAPNQRGIFSLYHMENGFRAVSGVSDVRPQNEQNKIDFPYSCRIDFLI
jgi:hypothetical protein